MKLGLKPARHDPRTLKFAHLVDLKALPPIPDRTNYRAAVATWPVLLNDKIGDCAIAAPAHSIQSWTTNDKDQEPFVATDAQVLSEYKAVSGYNGTPATDNGCAYLDVLNRWRQTGLFGHKILAYAKINTANHDEVHAAAFLCGTLQIGIDLPLAWKGASQWLAPTTRPTGEYLPGSWGGHAVPAIDSDKAKGITVCTWGGLVFMSWHALDTYCSELYATFSADQFGPDGIAANVLSWETVRQALKDITGQDPGPAPTPPPAPVPPTPGAYKLTLVSQSPISVL